MTATLSFVCVLQWRELRGGSSREARAFEAAVHRLESAATKQDARLLAAISLCRKEQLDLARALRQGASAHSGAPPGSELPKGMAPESSAFPATDTSGLPDLPEFVRPELLVAQPLEEILRDPALNPRAATIDRVQTARASLELASAQAERQVLDAQIRLEVTQAIEDLPGRNEFTEYAPGQKYEHRPGVVSAAEETEGGIRMFYLEPDRFPEIYDKKQRKGEVAERCARALVGILNPDGA